MGRSIHLSVRDFVAPLLREGSLNQVPTFAPTGGMRQVGQQIHADIQQKHSANTAEYRKEVFLSANFLVEQEEGEPAEFVVSGRADGVFENAACIIVEEIKSSTNLFALIHSIVHNAEHPYLLQAKMYGWLLNRSRCKFADPLATVAETTDNVTEENAKNIKLRLLLVNALDPDETETLELETQDEEFNFVSFEAWVMQRARDLLEQLKWSENRQAQRFDEGSLLEFPFSKPREGQWQLVELVSKCIAASVPLLVQAPTGLGKTVGVLFPNVKSAMLSGKQVFYLTPKNSQHALALEAIERMRGMGRDVRGVVITSKEKSCLKEEIICDPKYCEYADGYYDKLKHTGVLEELASAGCADANLLREKALQYKVCPFELSLDFTAYVDVVICDYNYVFSPQALLIRYFEEDARSHLVHLVIDEAHNLYSRSMELFSPGLSLSELEKAKEEGKAQMEKIGAEKGLELKKLIARFEKIIRQSCDTLSETSKRPLTQSVQEFARLSSSQVVLPDPDAFFKVERALGRFMTLYAQKLDYLSQNDPIFRFFRKWNDFCAILRLGGSEFIYTWQEKSEDGVLQCTCCDASRFLTPRIDAMASVTAFSATLKPFEFYAQMSGFTQSNLVVHEFPSPFPAENRKLLVIPQISTAYKDRQRNYRKIADVIEKVVSVRKGNYFVFFPSYQFLRQVGELVSLPSFRIYEQVSGMNPQDTQLLLKKLQQKTKNVLVLAVQGGALSEGIDLPGDDVIGAIVVGPSLPTVSLERECIRAYYEKKYGRGFDYAYVYPAMTRVVQAAGRVIRSPEDRGLLVLCDKRFLLSNYQEVMPQEWFGSSARSCVSNSILKDVEDFWRGAQ